MFKTLSASNIVKSLGYGGSYVSFITSITLAIITFFYTFTVANYFRIGIFFFQNRITYPTPFNLYLISGYADHIIIVTTLFVWLILSLKIETRTRYVVSFVFAACIVVSIFAHVDIFFAIVALLSIPVCISFLIYNRSSLTKRKFLNAETSLLHVNYVALIATLIAAISAVAILSRDLHLFSTQASYLSVHDYAYQIFDLISDVSPLAIFLLVGCIPVKLIMNASRKTLLSIKKKELDTNKNIKGASSRNEKHGITKRRCQNKYKDTHNYYLFLVVSASIGYSSNYTHPSVNRNNQQIGSDSDSYMNWTHALNRSNSAANFTKQAFFVQSSGERPVSLIFIYGGQYSLLTIIEQLPLIGTCAHFS